MKFRSVQEAVEEASKLPSYARALHVDPAGNMYLITPDRSGVYRPLPSATIRIPPEYAIFPEVVMAHLRKAKGEYPCHDRQGYCVACGGEDNR